MTRINYILIILTLCFVDYTKAEDNYSLGLKKYNLNDNIGAIADFSKAIEDNPKDAKAYCKRGNAKYLLMDYTGAIQDCTKSIEINSKYAEAYNVRGITERKLKDSISAIMILKCLLKLFP